MTTKTDIPESQHTPTLARRAFEPQGLLAIDPQAFGLMFDVFRAPEAPFALVANGRAAVVCVDGPLQTAGFFCDTYSAVRARVAAALASEAECVILKVSSPGGDVFGCFDTARALRAMARAVGKPLIGFTEANACSSAYALISASDTISASDSSVLGSIGVIATAVDASAQAEAAGLRFAIITSGARKSDGNPMVKLSADARKAMQTSVDAMAGVFFGLVKDHRGIEAEALEAGTFVGAAALDVGLCDRIESFDALLSRLGESSSGNIGATLSQTASALGASKASNMSDDKKDDDKKDEARAALAKAASAGNAKAKKALAAYDEDDDKKAEEPKKDEKAASEKDDEKAKADAPFEKKDDEKDKAAAAAILARDTAATAASSDLAKASARIAELEVEARDALFASRPDLSKEFRAACANLSLSTIKSLLAASPKHGVSAESLVGATTRAPAQGAQPDGTLAADRLPKAEADDLSIQMGLATHEKLDSVDAGVIQQFGVSRFRN